MNFKEFMLIEHKYSDKIELDEVINLLTKFFKNSKNIPTTFYRGMSNIGDYAIVEGSKSERRSSNTTNYYTMLIDDSIKNINKNYPLRSKSIICTNRRAVAENYDRGASYAIIPFPETIIGIVPSYDIWVLKIHINGITIPIHELNDIFDESHIKVTGSKADLAKDIFDTIGDPDLYLTKLFKDMSISDIKSILDDQYSIDTLGLKFYPFKDIKINKDEREVWIGDKCIAIKLSLYDNIIKKLDN